MSRVCWVRRALEIHETTFGGSGRSGSCFDDDRKKIANEWFHVFFAARNALTRFLPTRGHGEYCPRCPLVETSIDSGAGVAAI